MGGTGLGGGLTQVSTHVSGLPDCGISRGGGHVSYNATTLGEK